MAAATVAGSLFSDRSWPRRKVGSNHWVTTETIATTSLDDANDRVKFFPVENGQRLVELVLTHADLDSGAGALDMDVVLSDANGETILFNAGTAFNAARTTALVIQLSDTTNPQGIRVVDNDGSAWVGLKVNTPASTPAQGTVTLTLKTFS